MNLFVEKISEKTYNDIKQFLEENPSNELDFYTLQDGFKLHKKAFDELYESTNDFRKEFDEIISEFQRKTTGVDSYSERKLMLDTNIKLKDLYSRFVKNKEVWDLLDQLSSKTIKM